MALERVEGLKLRLSTMKPHDGPMSEYKSMQKELEDASVDYYYCLYFPSSIPFQYPPSSTMRKSAQQNGRNGNEYRLHRWNMVEQCMKKGALQDLEDRKISAGSPECLDDPSLGGRTEHNDGQDDVHKSTVMDPKEFQVLGQCSHL